MSKLSPANEIIVHSIAGHVVRQRTRDTYIDATGMCQAAGKLWGHYWERPTAKAFAAKLAPDIGIPITALIQSVRGGTPYLQGTWVHPRVAIHLGPVAFGRFRSLGNGRHRRLAQDANAPAPGAVRLDQAVPG